MARGAILAAILAAVALSPVAAHADQLIRTPTADLVPGPSFEYLQRATGPTGGYGTLFFPVGTSLEVMARYYDGANHDRPFEGGAQYQVLPDGVITPGIALGIWDVGNTGVQKRRAFAVLTKAFGASQLPVRVPKPLRRVQLDFGGGTGRFSGAIAGVRADFASGFQATLEFDSRFWNYGLSYSPIRPLALKAELQNGRPYFGLQLRSRL